MFLNVEYLIQEESQYYNIKLSGHDMNIHISLQRH